MSTTSTAYLLLVTDTTPDVYEEMTDDERRECLDRWNGWVDVMAATAGLRDGKPLGNSARRVTGAGGKRVVDGPFSEAKELVGGYFLLEDVSLDAATEVARRCPLLEHGMRVEIRPVVAACHLATSLGMETMRGPAAV